MRKKNAQGGKDLNPRPTTYHLTVERTTANTTMHWKLPLKSSSYLGIHASSQITPLNLLALLSHIIVILPRALLLLQARVVTIFLFQFRFHILEKFYLECCNNGTRTRLCKEGWGGKDLHQELYYPSFKFSSFSPQVELFFKTLDKHTLCRIMFTGSPTPDSVFTKVLDNVSNFALRVWKNSK